MRWLSHRLASTATPARLVSPRCSAIWGQVMGQKGRQEPFLLALGWRGCVFRRGPGVPRPAESGMV